MDASRSVFQHPWLRHLRLPFNLLLAPIFLWGVLLAGGTSSDASVWLAFVSLHLFLYGGTNAFNSYYDRDEGPIGGMLEPPQVDPGLLPFSLAVQALGVPLAWLVGPSFLVAYLLLFAVFTAYSHPAIRLKADPVAAMTAISLGQGGVGFIAGWLSVRPDPLSLASLDTIWGAATTCLLLTGLYIVTQSYQVDEDRARGDRTLPVVLGPGKAIRLAIFVSGVGGLALVAFVAERFGTAWAGALGAIFVAEGAWLWQFAATFDPADVRGNFRRVMRFATLSSAVLATFILWQLGT